MMNLMKLLCMQVITLNKNKYLEKKEFIVTINVLFLSSPTSGLLSPLNSSLSQNILFSFPLFFIFLFIILHVCIWYSA